MKSLQVWHYNQVKHICRRHYSVRNEIRMCNGIYTVYKSSNGDRDLLDILNEIINHPNIA